MKQCRVCKEHKSLEMFTKSSRTKTGYTNTCKACSAAYMKEYYRKNPDKANTNKSNQVFRDAKRNRFTKHGITVETYNEMLAKHDGMCWGCLERPGTHIDHDHKCCNKSHSCGSCVRGILCGQCNTALGLLQDDVVKIERLANYIRQTS